jgi:hypothetical protein
LSDSVVANNNGNGISVATPVGKMPTILMVRNATIANNVGNGLEANGTGSTGSAVIRVTKSTITNNGTGLVVFNGGQIISFGDNSLAGNTTDGAPTSTIPLK